MKPSWYRKACWNASWFLPFLPGRLREWLSSQIEGGDYPAPEDYAGHYCRDCADGHP